MYSFKNDYIQGAHQNILKRLIETNLEEQEGYGLDDYCKNASKKIKTILEDENVDIHFIGGGTQTNMIAISSFLRPHEAVISVDTAHIATHETGAIEFTGHKIITVPNVDGKLLTCHVKNVIEINCDEHTVKPRLIKISNSTETGTVYKKHELQELRKFCDENNLLLYLDGARLGTALTAKENDLTLKEICELTDAFYIGGTKNGALMGEALVIRNESLKSDFRYFIKQKGALMAKGRVLGIQFEELFTNNLYFDIAKNSNDMAEALYNGLKDLGFEFLSNCQTNQIFPIMSKKLVGSLKSEYDFIVWEEMDDDHYVVRLVTSWGTKIETVNKFLKDVASFL